MIIDGINTVINYKKARAMNAAIHTLKKLSSMNNEQIVRVSNHLLHVSKASLADIKGNRDNLYRFDRVGQTVFIFWINAHCYHGAILYPV